jgi:hypothetical protein
VVVATFFDVTFTSIDVNDVHRSAEDLLKTNNKLYPEVNNRFAADDDLDSSDSSKASSR